MSNLCRFSYHGSHLGYHGIRTPKNDTLFFLMFIPYSNRIRRVYAFTAKNTRICISRQMSLYPYGDDIYTGWWSWEWRFRRQQSITLIDIASGARRAGCLLTARCSSLYTPEIETSPSKCPPLFPSTCWRSHTQSDEHHRCTTWVVYTSQPLLY